MSFLKIAQGFLGRVESKTVSVDISCYLACSHGCTSAVDAPGTRAGWRRSKSLIRAGSCYRPDRNARHGEHGNRVNNSDVLWVTSGACVCGFVFFACFFPTGIFGS